MLPERLRPAFRGNTPVFLCDASEVVDRLRADEVEAYTFAEVNDLDRAKLADIVMIPTDFNATPLGKDIELDFAKSAMLVIPVASFCATARGALYFLEMFADVDLELCVNGNLQWLDRLETAPTVRMKGHGTDIAIELADEVFIMAPKTSVEIQSGEWVAVANFLEVGLISHHALEPPKHVINGVFSAEGTVCASHRYSSPDVFAAVPKAWQYLQDLRLRNDQAPIVVEVEDSRPVAISCGREDVLNDVMAFTDPDKREWIGEFAFASGAPWDLDAVDWTINSQFNEAIGGLHIGLGNGVTGVHIDFVAPRAESVVA